MFFFSVSISTATKVQLVSFQRPDDNRNNGSVQIRRPDPNCKKIHHFVFSIRNFTCSTKNLLNFSNIFEIYFLTNTRILTSAKSS